MLAAAPRAIKRFAFRERWQEMRASRRSPYGLVLAGLVVACVTANTSSRPLDFTGSAWQVRIDVDSSPTRNPAKEPTFGSIDFVAHRYSIDFWRAINHKLPNGAYAAAASLSGQYRFILGDSSSFDEKIVMVGRAVAEDSVVGTWTETIVCCAAGGRFTLWRSKGR